MKAKPKPPELIGGPYIPPRSKIGSILECRLRGPRVVAGYTDAPFPWPYHHVHGNSGFRSLFLCGSLVVALGTESTKAICHYWGVSRKLVASWKKGLGIGRTEGTAKLWRDSRPAKLPKQKLAKGGKEASKVRRRSGPASTHDKEKGK